MIYLCYAIMIIVPYLLCGINTAIIVTKIKTGEDIRTLGSGNAGLTNTLRTQGKIAALFVLLGDVLKGTLSILIVRFSFLWLMGTDTANPDNMMTYVGFAAAVAAIIGHVFPIYFGFKGGKGILVSVAVLMTVEWIPACILLGIFIIVVALRYEHMADPDRFFDIGEKADHIQNVFICFSGQLFVRFFIDMLDINKKKIGILHQLLEFGEK